MLKRTTGRILLALLVISGLSGTLNTGTISQKERKKAIQLIKTSRSEFINSIQGLSAKQLKYRPGSKDFSIGELINNLVAWEKNCNDEIKANMAEQSNAENRLKITLTDEQLLSTNCYALNEPASPEKISFKDHADAVKQFNAMRDQQIKYIRCSTEDLRNHVVKTYAGWIDCYQYYLLLADRSSYVAEMINKIKTTPRFPKK